MAEITLTSKNDASGLLTLYNNTNTNTKVVSTTSYYVVKIAVASLFLIVVLYITFCAQYAAAAGPALKPIFVILVVVYTLATLFLAFVAFDERWRADFARFWHML